MARGVNKVILIGNLGQDPEVRYTPNGSAVANVSLATSTSWRDKASGEMVDRTEWHRIVFFNRLAEIVGEYLRKGARIYVEGSLRTRKWQDKSGAERYTTEIIANEMQMLDTRAGVGGAPGAAAPGNGFSQSNQSSSNNDMMGNVGNGPMHSGPEENFDDDIPF